MTWLPFGKAFCCIASSGAIQDNSAMLSKRFVLGKLNVLARLPRFMQRIQLFFALGIISLAFSLSASRVAAQTICPDLSPFYPEEEVDWPALSQRLAAILPQCLESSEFFALYGAAQLNSGNIDQASESLELALLLEPDNAGAKVDYAQALFLQGQLFSALEFNQQLLLRQDLPANLQSGLQDRQRTWRSLTREKSGQLDLLAGYDDNLNGAPDSSQVTLTLSGEPVLLALNPEFRPNSGPYLNFRLAGRYRQLAPEHQHNFVTEVRARASEDTDSDLLQLDGRYAFIKPGSRQSWQINTGVSHLLFGGSSLYTATDARARYQRASSLSCKPYLGLALQHQLFHGQSHLNAVESKGSLGFNCPLNSSSGRQQINAEFSLLSNIAVKSTRPGSDREGWQVNLEWQFDALGGEIRSQLNHTQLDDSEGYSALLDNGAQRWLNRSYVLLQYRRSLQKDMSLMINMYHQKQHSNLELFRSVDSTIEIGISLAL